MQVIKEEGAAPIKAWVGTTYKPAQVWADEARSHLTETTTLTPDIEDVALAQLKNVARLPFIARNGVAVMPDVHFGIGATVGSVIATTDAIVPAAVGVDIGCGMCAVMTSLTADMLPASLAPLRGQIERDVPTGRAAHKDHLLGVPFFNANSLPMSVLDPLRIDGAGLDRAAAQLGSLGGGNHFIEICVDERGLVWMMLHSGSRGIGNKIGVHYINAAKEACRRWHVDLPDPDLAFLPAGDPLFDDYLKAASWAQKYALENRRLMTDLVLAAMRRHLPAFDVDAQIDCHHNYIARENHFGQNLWVTRKGAVRAREGDLVIIPGSMGQKSYIASGLGNPESYCSCSHGAGRVMSRTEAKKRFSLQDLADQTAGVECRTEATFIDEIPAAYKDLDLVMENQRDLVVPLHQLQAVLTVKGAE
jgi:tRNA-splicing ligase RtcB